MVSAVNDKDGVCRAGRNKGCFRLQWQRLWVLPGPLGGSVWIALESVRSCGRFVEGASRLVALGFGSGLPYYQCQDDIVIPEKIGISGRV